jgi:peptidoglycan hydrolase-like protein with peptidoglycan-binding domain
MEIIRYYYGSDMYINSSEYISGIPSSWPGYDLTVGSSGPKVLQMQQQLNRIAQNYPAIPKIAEDGIFGSKTENAVKVFQEVFGLPATGIVDFPTWFKISGIYVGVTRISEPD